MPEAGQGSDGAADDRTDLPRYDDLPIAGRGGRSAWGLFGPADSVGLLNLQTEARVLAADVLDNFFPQISSQWDSLAHVAYSAGVFYNGATDNDVLIGHRNTIDHWARRGIVGRGVLLDLDRALGCYRGLPRPGRLRLAAGLRAPGVEHTEEMARYLWDNQIMAVASDTFAVEVWPPQCGIGSPRSALAIK
jgi:hypothetical protein